MKKVTTILFAFFYLISIVGVAVNIHYCSGEIKDVAFFVDAESCCDDIPCDCCDDQTFLFQNLEEGVISQSNVLSFSSIDVLVESQTEDFFIEQKEDVNLSAFVDWTSPPKSVLRLKLCSLTFYG